MAITALTVVRLQELARTYLQPEELLDIARMHDLSLPDNLVADSDADLATKIVAATAQRIEMGANRSLLDTIVEVIDLRNSNGIANSRFERFEMHREMSGRISQTKEDLGEAEIPSEITVEDGKEFTAKAEVRDFFAGAEDGLLVIDPYVGPVTLDCFRSVRVPVRLLTGTRNNSVEGTFGEALEQFRGEGFEIEVRTHDGLHDRYAVLNERCFLIGSSLKHAGRKQLNIIEFSDARRAVAEILDAKWSEGDRLEV